MATFPNFSLCGGTLLSEMHRDIHDKKQKGRDPEDHHDYCNTLSMNGVLGWFIIIFFASAVGRIRPAECHIPICHLGAVAFFILWHIICFHWVHGTTNTRVKQLTTLRFINAILESQKENMEAV